MKSQKFIQRRRFYMVLPILIFPFVTLLFWALGGGKGGQVHAQVPSTGLNTKLPDAHFKKEADFWNKFALYEQAKRDSLAYQEARRNDPYFVIAPLTSSQQDSIKSGDVNTSLGKKSQLSVLESNERSVEDKLKELNDHLSRSPKTFSGQQDKGREETGQTNSPTSPPASSPDVDRLEQMMLMMQQEGGTDAEMAQIEGVLEKILDVQHPERLEEKYKAQRRTELAKTYAVDVSAAHNPVAMMAQTQGGGSLWSDSLSAKEPASFSIESNGFYSLDNEPPGASPVNGIEAVVHETQTLVSGSTIKLRLISKDVSLAAHRIPEDRFIYGTVSISGERLIVKISSIQSGGSLFPVSLKVYDLDGMEGIYMPGAIERDAAKQAGSQSTQEIQLMPMGQSLGVQAASAGIEATKNLFSKKAKLIKVTVKAGYKVLLYDQHKIKS